MKISVSTAIFCLAVAASTCMAADDRVIADFEGETYGAWQVEGNAFGSGPVAGGLPNQMVVGGFAGKSLANSFHGGDDATGKLVSPTFKIERNFLNFLIGGGKNPQNLSLNLLIDSKVVRSATGANDQPGGSENLRALSWNVTEFKTKTRGSKSSITRRAAGGISTWITLCKAIFKRAKPWWRAR